MTRNMARTAITLGTGLAAMVALAALAYAGAPGHAQNAKSTEIRLTFDAVHPGALPAGWKVEATNRRGNLAAWKVVADPTAPSSPNVLRAAPRSDNFGGTYNLCWRKDVRFLDGEIEVKLRANTGHEDQGGGPIWRVQDRNNYYVARYNPLERNFRVYIVKDGARRMLDSAPRIKIATGQWLTIRIVHKGDHIEGWLDGKQLLDVHDGTFTKPGGVGLWTKADAATSFDDFTVRPAGE